MDACHGELVADLFEHDLSPGFAGRVLLAVAHVVATDDEAMRLRAVAQDVRQRAHEDVETAVRLKVTVNEADQFIARAEEATSLAQANDGVWVRADQIRVDAVEDNDCFVAVGFGNLRALPARGGVDGIGGVVGVQVNGVFQAHCHAGGRLIAHGEFWVETGIGAFGGIKEFGKDEQFGGWPDILAEERFAPAWMGDDEVGAVAFAFEGEQAISNAARAQQLGIQMTGPRRNDR